MKTSGTPVLASVSLTNGAPGPTAFALQQVATGNAYTLATNEVFVVTNITMSSNDTAQPLVTVDDGVTGAPYTSRILGKYYVGASLPATTEAMALGVLPCRRGVVPRATASAVTAAKTVEITLRGYITTSS
jgi:hypothetical protein